MADDLERFKKALGKRIAFLRIRNNFTQAQLGALINKDYQSISRIENGKVNCSGYLLFQISVALDNDIGSLFEFE